MIGVIFTLIIIILIIVFCVKSYYDNKDLPPGPYGVPILGYLPFFKPEDVDGAVKEITAKYGPVVSVRFGTKLIVFLCDYDCLKEAFVKYADYFHGRPKDLYTATFSNRNRGVIMNEGEEWKVLRRYTMSSLRDFGMGKLSLQGKMHEELFHFFNKISTDGGSETPFNPRSMFSSAVTNVFCNIMCGHRFDYSDPEFNRLVETIYTSLSEGFVRFLTWFPVFRFVPPFKAVMNALWNNTYFMWDFIGNLIQNAKKSNDSGVEEVTFLQAIVKEAQTSEPARAAVFNKNMLYNTCQLYLAGAETTSTSLEWACYWLIIRPDLQERMQQEIDQNIDPSHLPKLEDKHKLPLTEAFCLEILRMCPVLPLGVPHATTSEVWFRGYRIPERTIVFSHLGGILKDPKFFENPTTFIPERFIDKDGKVDYRKTSFVPFSMGKRQCLGESLARMELFCFMTTMLQNYTVLPPPGQHLEAPERFQCGVTSHPPYFEMLLQPRYPNKETYMKRFDSVF